MTPGARLHIGWSWALLVPVLGVALFVGTPIASGSTAARIAVAAAGTVAVLGSVILHELGHVAAARVAGVAVRGVRVFFLGGHTDADLDRARPGVEVAVAAAGPAASAFAALVVAGIAVIVPDHAGTHRVLGVVVMVNVVVAIASLLPALPFDGGRMVRGGLRATGWRASRVERLASAIAAVVGVVLALSGLAAAAAGRALALVLTPAGVMLGLLALSPPTPVRRVAGVMRLIGSPVTESDPVPSDGPPVPVVRGTRVVGVALPGAAGLAGESLIPLAPGDLVEADAGIEVLESRSGRPVLVVDRGRPVGVVLPGEPGPERS